MKYLHEKKEVKATLGLKDKKVLAEYNKERYIKRSEEKREAKASGFVTQSNWELVFGIPSESPYYRNKEVLSKYVLKYGEFQGTHAKIDRR